MHQKGRVKNRTFEASKIVSFIYTCMLTSSANPCRSSVTIVSGARRSNSAVLKTRAVRPLVLCGEYALVIYSAGVLLSFGAHALLSLGWNSLVSQTLVSFAGLAVMSAIAALLALIDRSTSSRVHLRPL